MIDRKYAEKVAFRILEGFGEKGCESELYLLAREYLRLSGAWDDVARLNREISGEDGDLTARYS